MKLLKINKISLALFSLGMKDTDSDACNELRKDKSGSCYPAASQVTS